MVFTHPSTQNWSRAFTVWINDIQVIFPSQAVVRVIRGGFLRRVRTGTRAVSAVITVFFALHCTRAHTALPEVRPSGAIPASALPSLSLGMEPLEGLHEETGLASWYGDGDGFEELETASGEILQPHLATCAHRTLPFGTLLEVENLENDRRTLARVNDRGPFVKGRILDVSSRVARDLRFRGRGVVHVRVRTVVPEGRPAATPRSPSGRAGGRRISASGWSEVVQLPPSSPSLTCLAANPAWPNSILGRAPRELSRPQQTLNLPQVAPTSPVALARDASARIHAPFLQLVADTIWWLLGTGPVEDGFSHPKALIHGRPPFLHREDA